MSPSSPQSNRKIWRPQSGLIASLPESWAPFAQLMRLHKPIGIMNIFFPYLFGLLFTACVSKPLMRLEAVLLRSSYLLGAAFILRSAGCTWNDIVDRDLDCLVERTKLRPMARGAVTLQAASFFAVAQTSAWLTLVWRILPDRWLIYAVPLLFFVSLYPFAKRFTDYAQVVLGITLGWGVLAGAAVGGLDALNMNKDDRSVELAGLYAVYFVWTIIHDTVYAHQDVRDDVKAGIKSMAVRWLDYTKGLLWGLATMQIGLLWSLGTWMGAQMWYFYFAVCGDLVVLTTMILKVDLGDPRDCFRWFETSSLLVGLSIAAGLFAEYLVRCGHEMQ
nr:putative prenyltransferase [Cladonia uncialis subsp. uncialis]